MPNPPHDPTIRAIADGATAQLRVVMVVAEREESRRLHAELLRIAATLEVKWNFGRRREKEMAVLG